MILYRSDIDGLRAIAVLSVVLYHASFAIFEGGFVGVDVFFVISGFLITSLILKEIETEVFSFTKFYERRIRRLAPALIPVLIFTYIGAVFLFTPSDFKLFSQSLIAFIIFASNWLFLSQTGYFDTSAETKPLLHTWSLSIEEQFYLFMPFTLLVLSRFNRKLIKLFIISLFVFSLILAIYWVKKEQLDLAFFNSVGRFWELLTGSLLAVGFFGRIKNLIAITATRLVGFLLILIPIFIYNHATAFPGAAAIIPTLGTALIIYASPRTNDIITVILSWPPVVYVGRISYSWYLWHWPIFVFIRIYYPHATIFHMIVGVVVSFILSILSYHTIEIPVRHKIVLAKRRHMYALFGGMVMIFMIAGPLGYFTEGLPQRFSRQALQAIQNTVPTTDTQEGTCAQGMDWETAAITKLTSDQVCVLGVTNRDHYDFIVIGDSHAHMMRQAFHVLANMRGLKGALAAYNACPPLVNVSVMRHPNSRCEVFNAEAHRFINRHDIRTIFLVSNWAVYLHGYFPNKDIGGPRLIRRGSDSQGNDRFKIFAEAVPETIDSLLGRTVYVLGSVPNHAHRVPETLALEKQLGRSQAKLWTTRHQYLDWQKSILEIWIEQVRTGRAIFIDLTEHFCASGQCLVEINGFSLYTDTNHLSTHGVLFVQPLLEPAFASIETIVRAAEAIEKEHR